MMKVSNIKEIYDNGEFVSIITLTKTAIHLPNEKHSITLVVDDRNNVDALVEFKEG